MEQYIDKLTTAASADYVRKRFTNPDYPVYNDEYELESAFEAGAKWGMEQAEVKIQAQSIAVDHGCPKESLSNDLEEAAENYPSIIRTISPQWEAEVESAFIAGAKWQKEQTIEKICKWLEDNVDHYAYNKDFVPNAKERFIKMFRRAEI